MTAHWSFVISAYLIALVGLSGLFLHSLRAMRRAEKKVDQIRKQQEKCNAKSKQDTKE